MSYTYTTYKDALQVLVASNAPDPDFDAILPSAIDYAEQRIYRELNLLSTTQVDQSTLLVPATREASIPNTFVVVNNINVMTPNGAISSATVRNPLTPVSRDVLDAMWPSASLVGVPSLFSMVTQWTLILGPAPDLPYYLEVVGTTRPNPLTVSNPTTFLTDRLPDLFMAASMVFMSGYMRNFGTQASDPQQGMSWETQYQALKGSADTEEARKKFWGASWTPYPVSSAAQPQRG